MPNPKPAFAIEAEAESGTNICYRLCAEKFLHSAQSLFYVPLTRSMMIRMSMSMRIRMTAMTMATVKFNYGQQIVSQFRKHIFIVFTLTAPEIRQQLFLVT